MLIFDEPYGPPPTPEQREKLLSGYREILLRKSKNICITSFRIPEEEFNKIYPYDLSHYILTGEKIPKEKQQ